MMEFSLDGVLLADVPGSGVSRIDTNAKSGNPRHDSRSGKFGAGGAKPAEQVRPDNVNQLDFARMLDAAREAAREFDNPQEGDIRDFLAGRARNPEAVDIQGFLRQVQEERKNDLVDLLDQQIRSGGPLQRGRRRVGLKAPRGYLKRLIGSAGDDDLAEIMHRLEAMGHKREDVNRFFQGRVKDETHKTATAKRDSIQASDQWQNLDAEWDYVDSEDDEGLFANSLALVEKIAQHLPQPIVNVTVESPRRTSLDIKRDEKGLMKRIESGD